MPIVWKVTTSKKRSAVIVQRILARNYKIGETTTAPVGGLLCFKTLKDAILWKEECGYSLIIFKAQSETKVPLGNNFYTTDSKIFLNKASLRLFKKLWRIRSISTFGWPKGTVAYKKVTLLKEYKL